MLFGRGCQMQLLEQACVDVPVKLSSNGVANIRMELYEGSFEFIVGDMQHKCNPIIAEFLSPKISRLREADPTICQYILETTDSSLVFKDFLSLPFKSEFQIAGEHFPFFVSVARELENQELLSQLVRAYFAVTEITVSNAATFLSMRQLICKEGGDEEEISFIASHFNEVKNTESIDVHSLRRILGHSSLRIESEDSLYNFISGLIEKDRSFSELLEFVVFEFLGPESVQKFVRESRSFIFDALNLAIWNSICARLCKSVIVESSSGGKQKQRFGKQIIDDEVEILSSTLEKSKQDLSDLQRSYGSLQEKLEAVTEERKVIESELSTLRSGQKKLTENLYTCEYNESNQFNGIIAHLSRQCGGNVHEKGVVNITSSGCSCNKCHQIVNYGESNAWLSTNVPNSWVMFDFKEHAVILRDYTIKSCCHEGHLQLLNWKIEGSNDGSDWTEVDSRSTDFQRRTEKWGVRHFQCARTDGAYRFIKLTQTGKNYPTGENRNQLVLDAIEFFGSFGK